MKLYEENITGEILKHMIHSEDLVELGPKGGKLVYESFVDIFETLRGNTPKGSSKIRLKIDGAPAVVSATNYYGKKFVALKHSWDKGKIFESPEAINIEYGDRPELANKLIKLFNNLDFINIPQNEIWMGDYLFSKEDLKTISLEGVDCVAFQPNTIVYAVPLEDPIASLINKADIGIAWHTKYTGPNFQNLKINFNVSVNDVNSVPSVYQMDAELPNMAGKLTLTADESKSVIIALKQLKTSIVDLYNKAGNVITNENLILLINTYRNAIIKNFDNPNQFPELEGFKQWLETRKSKEKDTKKTDKGKNAVEERYNTLYQFIDSNSEGINALWDTQKQIVGLKELFESKLNTVSHLKSYVNHISQGYIPTSGEGYAVSDIDGNVQKLVSRLEFSRNNFDNKNIIKGWTSDKRMAESEIKKFNSKNLSYNMSKLKNNLEESKVKLNEENESKLPVSKDNCNLDQQEAMDIVARAKEEYKGSTLDTIDPTQNLIYADSNQHRVDLLCNSEGDGRYERREAFQKIADYIKNCGDHQKNDDSYSFYYTVNDEEVKKATSSQGGGGHTTPITIFKDDKSNGKHSKICSIYLRHTRKSNGSSGIKIDPSDFVNTPELNALKDAEGNYTIKKDNVPIYINGVINQTKHYYGDDSPEVHILEYFFDQNKTNIDTHTDEINILRKESIGFKVQLCELVVPYLILTKRTLNNKDLIPDDITVEPGCEPINFIIPTSAVQKYVDSIVTFKGNKGQWELKISCKAGSGTNVGETSIITIFRDGLYDVNEHLNDTVKSETQHLSESFTELANNKGPKHYHMGSIWMEGLRIVSTEYGFNLPPYLTKFETWKNMRALYDKSLKVNSSAYPIPTDQKILKSLSVNGDVYEGLKNTLNKAIDIENSNSIKGVKQQSISKDLFNKAYPQSITSVFGIMIANRIRAEKESLIGIEKAMSKIGYYQYKMNDSYDVNIVSVGNGGSDDTNIEITDPSIDFEYKWVRYTAEGFHTNSVDFGVIIK